MVSDFIKKICLRVTGHCNLELEDHTLTSEKRCVRQEPADIPLLDSVDVVVVGCTSAAVALAKKCKDQGASVYLVAPRSYPGEELCATLRICNSPDKEGNPAALKARLAEELTDAGVKFVYLSYVTDLLQDQSGNLRGLVFVSRGGRKAIASKVVVDATINGRVAANAGAEFIRDSETESCFEFNILRSGIFAKHKLKSFQLKVSNINGSFTELNQLRQLAGDLAPLGLMQADDLWSIPLNRVVSIAHDKRVKSLSELTVDHCKSKTFENLYILSACIDSQRVVAAELMKNKALRRLALLVADDICDQIGGSQIDAGTLEVKTKPFDTCAEFQLVESFSSPGLRDGSDRSVHADKTTLPVLLEVDVVVVGGGTAGAAAAIAAARRGAKTLVVEMHQGLGGIGTLGLIGKPFAGKRLGFAKEVPFPGSVAKKMEWYRKQLREAGGEIWFQATGCGAVVDGNQVKGVALATPEGRCAVLAKVVVDATGSADVAIDAGADYMFAELEKSDIAIQGTGLASRGVRDYKNNTDYLMVDESDDADVWRTLTGAYIMYKDQFDVGAMIQTRERRRILGDFTISYVDQLAGRTYPAAVVVSASAYDSHGYPSSPIFALLPHNEASRKRNFPAPGGEAYTPYRAFLPKGIDGILVAGLGISMHRDASAMLRMQHDISNQGFAIGTAAAMAAKADINPRNIDIGQLQEILVSSGSLPTAVLGMTDSFPVSLDRVQAAVETFMSAEDAFEAGKELALIMTHQDCAVVPLKRMLKSENAQFRIRAAMTLGVFGERSAFDEVLRALQEVQCFDPPLKQGRMADYAYLPTYVDGLLIALGYLADRRAIAAVIEKISLLGIDSPLSHHRAAAFAVEHIGAPEFATHVADLLQRKGMHGYAQRSLFVEGYIMEKRTESLREISWARALFKCGDCNQLARSILANYRTDLRGVYAKHAASILDGKPTTSN